MPLARQVRAHHFHHSDRQRDAQVIEILIGAVVNRAVGEQAREAALAGFEQRRLLAHIQVGLLLAGEACGRQILGGGGAAHRDTRGEAVLGLQFPIGLQDLGLQRIRQRRVMDDRARTRPAAPQILGVIGLEPVERRAQRLPGVGGVEHAAIGLGGDGEAVGNLDPLAGQLPIHLPEGRVLAADQPDVANADVAEEANELICHRQ